MSYVSGLNGGTPNEKTHSTILKEAIFRRAGAEGPGVNSRYGKPSGGRRKSRGKIGTSMARRGTRRSSRGIFSRLYSPVGHLLSAGKESVGAVTNTAKGVVGEGVHGLDKIGRSVTKHANMAVKDVFTRKRKGGGKRKGSRKSRKSKRTTRRR